MGCLPTEAFTINGGPGNDTLIGANGNDTLIGGTGNDFADGNIGADQSRVGGGNDTVQWDPGDGSDVVNGGGGRDRLAFNGSNIGEHIDLTANGSRVRLSRDVARSRWTSATSRPSACACSAGPTSSPWAT